MITFNLSKRERCIFISAVSIIILTLFYNFLFEPILKKWNTLNNEIVIKKTQFGKNLQLLKNRNKIISEYNTYASSVRNISKILSRIEREADSLGIKTYNIRPRPVIQKELYKEYIIELQIEGEFLNIDKFISQLAEPPLFITVVKFEFRKTAETSSYFKGTLLLSKLII